MSAVRRPSRLNPRPIWNWKDSIQNNKYKNEKWDQLGDIVITGKRIFLEKKTKMSFLTALLEQLFGRSSADLSPLLPLHQSSSASFSYEVEVQDDGDEDPLLDEDEEEEENYDPEAFRTNQEFVEYILARSDNGTNYFFDMFNTETRNRVTGQVLQIWWMSRFHPYACMLRRSDAAHFRAYDSYREVVAYQDAVIQEAVDVTRNIVLEWQEQLPQQTAADVPPLEKEKEDEDNDCITVVSPANIPEPVTVKSVYTVPPQERDVYIKVD